MKTIKCPKCGNTSEFYEVSEIVRTKHFIQQKDGKITLSHYKDNLSNERDSRIFCSRCGNEIISDYHKFLDNIVDHIMM
jgi:DNA-directed RNA polymerase subunit M/transcription elongation factor TFIIS